MYTAEFTSRIAILQLGELVVDCGFTRPNDLPESVPNVEDMYMFDDIEQFPYKQFTSTLDHVSLLQEAEELELHSEPVQKHAFFVPLLGSPKT